MGMVQLLFGFNGRINRKQYWLTGLASGGAIGILAAALNIALAHAPAAMFCATLAIMVTLGWIGLALNVKRFHDRGRTGYLALAPLIPAVMIFTTIASSLTSNEAFFSALQQAVLWLGVSGLINIWFFIDLGLLPGEDGPNRFGGPPGTPGAAGAPSSNPRPGKAAAAASSMFGAEQAMERALAEQQMRAKAPPAPRAAVAPKPATAAAAAPSFGRRVVQ